MPETTFNSQEASAEELFSMSEAIRYFGSRFVLPTDGIYWLITLSLFMLIDRSSPTEAYLNRVEIVAWILAVAIPLLFFGIALWVESRLRMSLIRSHFVMLRLRNQLLLSSTVVFMAAMKLRSWAPDHADIFAVLTWPLLSSLVLAIVLSYVGRAFDHRLLPPLGTPGIKAKSGEIVAHSSLRTRLLDLNRRRTSEAARLP